MTHWLSVWVRYLWLYKLVWLENYTETTIMYSDFIISSLLGSIWMGYTLSTNCQTQKQPSGSWLSIPRQPYPVLSMPWPTTQPGPSWSLSWQGYYPKFTVVPPPPTPPHQSCIGLLQANWSHDQLYTFLLVQINHMVIFSYCWLRSTTTIQTHADSYRIIAVGLVKVCNTNL